MQILDLFSGIGGFSLGLERAGMTTAAFCEVDPFCRAVLNARWPGVYVHDDIRTLTADTLRSRGLGDISIIVGGYPCQPFSTAGKRGGAEDDRHLWPEMRRLVEELRPAWVVGENVAGHITLGLDQVLSDLDTLGYASRAFVIPAVAVDAPHRRDRVWIVANANSRGKHDVALDAEVAGAAQPVADASSRQRKRNRSVTGWQQGGPSDGCRWPTEPGMGRVDDGLPRWMDPADWLVEPEGVPRVAKGIENRAQRLMALGNSIVPQIMELIGKAIVQAKQEKDNEQSTVQREVWNG